MRSLPKWKLTLVCVALGALVCSDARAQTAVYYSVGESAADLKNGSPTVTIAGGVATFTSAQPDNVGLGDEITYNGGTRAYISGRTSATVYSVTTATGAVPPNVAGATVNSILRAFDSLTNAEASSSDASHLNATDLIVADVQLNWACYDDAPMDDDDINIDGWTTGPAHYIRIFAPHSPSEVGASQRHSGVAGTGFRLERSADLTGVGIFRYFFIFEEYVRVEGIELDGSSLSNGNRMQAIRTDDAVSPVSDLRFESLIIHDFVNSDVDNTSDMDVFGFLLRNGSVKISNTVIYNLENANTNAAASPFAIQTVGPNAGTSFFYNNTIYNLVNSSGNGNPARGIARSAGTVTARNNAVLNMTPSSVCFQGAMTQNNNVSSDATATGATGQTSYATYFESIAPGSEDLHLLGDSVTLWGIAGADLDADAALPITADIDGELRHATAPDIGADELDVNAVFYSVGIATVDLKSGSPDVTIANGVATLTVSQPDYVGVGDEITYNGATRAYISGRTSDTVYTVTTATGATPPPIAGATVNSIVRAFNSLKDAALQSDDGTHLNTSDLVAANVQLNWPCYNDGPDPSHYVRIEEPWITGPAHYIRVFTPTQPSEVGVSQRHTGVAGTGYRIAPNGPAGTDFFNFILASTDNGYVRVEGVEIDGSGLTNGENVRGLMANDGVNSQDVWFIENLIHDITNTTIDDTDQSRVVGIFLDDTDNSKVANNIVYNLTSVSASSEGQARGIHADDPGTTHHVYNNTVYNVRATATTGAATGIFDEGGSTTLARNNYVGRVESVLGAELDFSGTFAAETNNVSSDGTAVGAGSVNGQASYASYFLNVAPGSENFHLLAGSDVLWGAVGADLDNDPTLPVTNDIDTEARHPTTPDIGADESLGAVGLRDVYYSVGTSAADLKTGSPAITITAGTATLSVAQTGNLGVGDLIAYGGSQFVVIHAVVSQTVFAVRTPTGLVPPDTGAVAVSSITRVFASITLAESGTAAIIGTTDLAAASVRVTWVVYNDMPLVEAAQIDGYVTDATHFITLTAASASQVASGVSQRHYGTAATGAVVRPGATAPYAIYVGDPYTVVEWLELDGTNVTVTASDGVEVGVGGWNATLQNLVVHHWDETNDDGIWVNNDNVVVRNSFIYDNEGSLRLDGNNATVQNVTIYSGDTYGLHVGSTNGHTVENVISMGNPPGSDFEASPGDFAVVRNNMSSDATADDFGGSGHLVNRLAANQFVNLAGPIDLHLKSGADAIDAGIDRSGFFTGDIDAQTRAFGAGWEIGADETGWSSSNVVYYSIGIDGGNLMAGSPTVDVVSGTATFSTAQPNNVGAGDVITYGGNTAYIWRRASSTVYYVVDAVGGVPPDASTSVTSITRAFTSLTLAQAGSSDASHLNGADLVAGDFQLNWVCYDDGPLDDRLDLAGWTTGPDNYIRIYTPVSSSEVGVSQRHTGIAGSGFRIAPNDATVAAYQIIFLRTEFVRIEGLELDGTGLTSARSVRGVGVLSNLANAGDIRVSSNIIHDLHTTQSGNNFDGSFGIYAFADIDNMGPPLLVTNNFIYDITANISEDNHHIGGIHISTRTTSRVYNNTIFHVHNTGAAPGGATWGIEVSGWPVGTATVVATNNFIGDLMSANDVEIAFESNNGGVFTQSYNVSSDGTAIGTGSQTGQTSYGTYFQNISDATEDLHITAASATLWGTSGTDLSSSFTVDIDGGLRQTPWDIGADDVLATTAVTLIGFEANALDGAVALEWETGSELDNLGFHVYRSLSSHGPYERITSNVIPGLGSSPVGARYSYRDGGLANGTTYFYELQDIETTGATKRHGPVSAIPSAGASAPDDDEPGTTTRITYGDPSANGLRVVKRGKNFVELELTTEGFYAVPQEDGSVALEIPGFESLEDAGGPSVPVERHWLAAPIGRKVELVSVRGRMEPVVGSWKVSSAAHELMARSSGTVRTRQRRRMKRNVEGLFPADAARIATVAFQGESKKALVEMAPLRWVAGTGELYLTRRMVVRVSFRGVEPSERRLDGNRGRRRTRKPALGHGVLARLLTTERGLYGARYEDLFGARGRVPVDELRLSRQGEDVAFHVEPAFAKASAGRARDFRPGSTLYFVSAGAAANPYGSEAVYELQLASGAHPGTRMERGNASPSGPEVAWYWKRNEQEVNRYYQAALVHAPDLWLWDLLLAPVSKSYPFEVTALASTLESSRLDVWLQGTSDTPAAMDHHVRVYVNGTFLSEMSWNGKTARKLTTELAPGVLMDGENVLELENVGDTEASYSTVMLDRFAVAYPRRLVPEAGVVEGTFGESGTATVSGHIIETTKTPRWIVGGPSFGVDAGASYLMVEPSAVRTPEIRRPTASTLTSRNNRADYVVLGPREFLEAAAPLLTHRAEQGLVSKGVAIEDVYAEFGHGESTPEAIRAFLSYAYHEWQGPTLRYVVLLGDGSYDYKDYSQLGQANPVPPLMVRTSYLWTASDPTLAAVNGDDLLPDIAIGRLPASSVDEVAAMVNKILAWESNAYTLDGPAVLVADNPDLAGNFVADADAAAKRIPTDITRIYLNELGASATTSSIVNAFDEGASLMSYIGHGGIHLWADENVFNTSKLSTMSPQARQPVLLTMNCLNGYFHFPHFGSLAEELLKAEHKGVIAAFSPSGLSLNTPAQRYHQAMLDELFSGGHLRLGDAVLGAQETYVDSGAFPELVSIYHLFGDPALVLR